MNIIRISHGIGNQMFQYAFSIPIQKSNHCIKFDLSFYDNYTVHNGFELEKVFHKIKIDKTDLRDVFYFAETKIENKEKLFVLRPGKQIITESSGQEFSYNPSLQNLDDTYFKGYWQNISYFKRYENKVKEYFAFPPFNISDKKNRQLASQLANSNSVSIHIRRGDYLQSSMHMVLQTGYYTKAIEKIKDVIADPVFFIFSDDIEWAKQNLEINDAIFVQQPKKEDAFRDMQLMSLCKHNIIANSTFSWWAAWLNGNNHKIVITPARWFIREIDMSCLLLDNWIKIEV